MAKYYPLHAHTSVGSIGDSVLGIQSYVSKAKEYGLESIAITDHGSISGIYSFMDECRKQGIKPIVGMEAYVVANNDVEFQKENKLKKGSAAHLVLLAKNNEGLENLIRIHNQAATEGFYYEARTDHAHLKQWGNGIIGLSACVGGEIPRAILNDDIDEAKRIIEFYNDVFDEFYLEIQPGMFVEQVIVNDTLAELSEEMNVPLVITNDIHYLSQEDATRHNYHVKLARKMKDVDITFVYPDDCYWFMDGEDIRGTIGITHIVTIDIVDKAIEMTKTIADKCNIEMNEKVSMPVFPIEGEETEEEKLYRMCYTKLGKIIEKKPCPQAYADRLYHELKVISDKGFCGYFLIVADYLNWARNNDIAVGPGRGSAAGSLVAYLLNICQADPIQYGLLFERFLDPARDAIPDIDSDTEPGENGREKLFEYVVNKYGYEHCALVSTLGMRKAKGAVHDAARILGYKPQVGNDIAKFIPTVYYDEDGEKNIDMSIREAIDVVPELKKYEKSHSDILNLASDLEGLPSSNGIHAAGIIISPDILTNTLPLIKPNKEGILATAVNLEDAEKFCVKFDFLALGTLSVLKKTEQMSGVKFDYQDESLYNDEEVWKMIGSKDTTGLFQISSPTYRSRMPRLKPTNIQELAACLALIRGPAISAKTDELYMRIAEGKEEIHKVHPIYDDIVKDTNGVVIYQEQIMKLAVAFGMDLSTGYRIVKLSANKKFEELEEYRVEFVRCAEKKNCDNDTANKIFDVIVDSSKYLFNQSHAVSYALLTYASAWLKTYCPVEFMANLLTYAYEKGKDQEYATIIKDCRKLGIKFLPADIIDSSWEFTVEEDGIRIGLCAVKGLGKKAAEAIEEAKKLGIYTLDSLLSSIEELKLGRVLNKKVITICILAGLLGEDREEDYRDYLDSRGESIEDNKIKVGTKELTSFSSKYLNRQFYGANFF
jgi:DNA polymerase III, alpha subunit